ncbi:hypothetical protein NBRC111894_3665 [Sporolactobacillus inulinus]|uniref:Uncharacterized protein n=1 Tax=Sporolactobacillus inulinus TaxID=2078 RepID=A0A4Y1ZGN7_9BACL|nr:hypothetical protein NBRC111894_3665 [Sporolactobacillus inulinus]
MACTPAGARALSRLELTLVDEMPLFVVPQSKIINFLYL